MLTRTKLNNAKKTVNQELTARGIKKADHDLLMEAAALTLTPRSTQTDDAMLEEQYLAMKKENKQKKLLDYQLKTNPMAISSFLTNKYTDGNFNIPQVDRYDNSPERLSKGITFEYHVYLPDDPRFDSQRGHNRYALSEQIHDRRTGDLYIYHIPVHLDSSGSIPLFITDYGENPKDPKSHGLLWALKEFRKGIDSRSMLIPGDAEKILVQWGFIKDGKIIHDIIGNMKVEKYLRGITPIQRRDEAVLYLDSSLKAEVVEIIESTPVSDLIAVPQKIAPDPLEEEEEKKEDEPATTTTTTTSEEDDEDEDAADEDDEDEDNEDKESDDEATKITKAAKREAAAAKKVLKEAEEKKKKEEEEQKKKKEEEKAAKKAELDAKKAEHDEKQKEYDDWIESLPKYTPVAEIKITPVVPGKKMDALEILKDNNIPVYEYTQVKPKQGNRLVATYMLFYSNGHFYNIGFYTGSKTHNINSVRQSARKFESNLLHRAVEGLLKVPPLESGMKEVLKGKQLSELTEDKALPIAPVDFTPRRTV